jgi:hypothetical protein
MTGTVLSNLKPLNRLLKTRGFPDMSPWWLETLTRFYISRCRQLVLRVGRRGGKSTSLCRVAVLEALYGDHIVPPGDVGIVGIVSVSRDEAAQRLRTIRAILDALGVKYKERGDTLELLSKPVAFKVYTASLAGVVGGTWICAVCDELCSWRDSDSGANPATEVLASLRPTLATMPNARMFLSSSPRGQLDAHAKAYDVGDNEYQLVAYAPSWIANPSITEAQTRELEPTVRAWKREFLATPQGALTSVFALDDIDACIKLGGELGDEAQAQSVIVLDPSRGTDEWPYGLFRYVWSDGHMRLRLVEIKAVANAKDTEGAIKSICNYARLHNAAYLVSDQYMAPALTALASQNGFSLFEVNWSGKSKMEAVDFVDAGLRDRTLLLPHDPTLRTQLIEYSEKIGGTGAFTYAGAGRHDDRAAVVVSAAMAVLANRVPLVDAPPVAARAASKAEADRAFEERWVGERVRAHERAKELSRDMWGPPLENLFDEYTYLPAA